MRRVYQRQRKGVHRGDNWEDFLLRDLPQRTPVAPSVPGSRFGNLRRTMKRLRPGEIIYTCSARFRVVER